MEYTDKQFWDDYSKDYRPHEVKNVVFADVFEQYLTPDRNKTVLEIGCAGGEFLVYFAKYFGYQTFGVDFSDEIDKTRVLFMRNHLVAPTLYKVDFFRWQAPCQYDLVCSFVFVEHFENINDVVERHARLVKPGGMLIITMPHFAGLQYYLHWILDRENLKHHNTKVMNLKALRNALQNLPFEIVLLNYYQTFSFWTEKKTVLDSGEAAFQIHWLSRAGDQQTFWQAPAKSFFIAVYYTSGRATARVVLP